MFLNKIKMITKKANLFRVINNLYFNKDQEDYAKMLCKNSFSDKVFLDAIQASYSA